MRHEGTKGRTCHQDGKENFFVRSFALLCGLRVAFFYLRRYGCLPRAVAFHFQWLRDFGFRGAAHAKLAEQTHLSGGSEHRLRRTNPPCSRRMEFLVAKLMHAADNS